MVLVAGPRPIGGVAKSTKGHCCFCVCTGTLAGQSATWAPACCLKMALFGLGLQWGFAMSYLDPKTPTKALLSVHGYQIIVAKEQYEQKPPSLPSC